MMEIPLRWGGHMKIHTPKSRKDHSVKPKLAIHGLVTSYVTFWEIQWRMQKVPVSERVCMSSWASDVELL